jgi:Asp-tRNA(Asn)/Glu-tRNA(Gln) amidotransferase A subunit family amidase
MPSDPFAYASAAELAALIRSKQASSTEVMRATLARAE